MKLRFNVIVSITCSNRKVSRNIVTVTMTTEYILWDELNIYFKRLFWWFLKDSLISRYKLTHSLTITKLHVGTLQIAAIREYSQKNSQIIIFQRKFVDTMRDVERMSVSTTYLYVKVYVGMEGYEIVVCRRKNSH